MKIAYKHTMPNGLKVYECTINKAEQDAGRDKIKKDIRETVEKEIGKANVTAAKWLYQRPHLEITTTTTKRLYIMGLSVSYKDK